MNTYKNMGASGHSVRLELFFMEIQRDRVDTVTLIGCHNSLVNGTKRK